MTPISPRRRLAALVTTALAITAIAAPTAGARFVPEGPDAGVYCGKDYSQNSATGDYCVRLKATSSSPAPTAGKHDGFTWGEAETGGAALVLLIAAAGGTAVVRRRRAGSAARRHSAPVTT
jgi:hypothetical protein